MRGVSFAGDRKIAFIDVADPTPGPSEVVLEIKASGMCGSDLKFYRAPSGAGVQRLGIAGAGEAIVAGHEPCGVVVAVGSSVPSRLARVGQRVMVHHYSGCGGCAHCRTGWAQLCQEGITVYGVNGHGAHAPYMKVPASTLVDLPDELNFETGAAISCGTGTAYYALRRSNLSGRDTVAIFGQGPVGLSATQLAKAMGATVIALDINPARLARSTEFGADHIIDPSKESTVDRIKEITKNLGADISLETSGASSARADAVRATRTWGTACYVGEDGTVSLNVSPDLLRKQMTILGSWTFSTVGQAECAKFVAEREVPVDRLFTDRWALSDAEAAYQLFDTQSSGKGVFLA
jgi:threonine dehydrogenase-like Zn-dependent dehydrogenase